MAGAAFANGADVGGDVGRRQLVRAPEEAVGILELPEGAGGPPEAVAKVRPVLDVIGGRIWDMGPEAPTANAAKVACKGTIDVALWDLVGLKPASAAARYFENRAATDRQALAIAA